MNEIKRVLKIAAWRLFVLDLFRTFAITVSAALLGLIGLLLVERIFGLNVTWPRDWERALGVAAAAAVVGALVWSAVRRARGVAVARELDERANLRESLSTAMCVAASEDAWAKVVVETARQKAVTVKVNQAIPYTAPKLWPLPFGMALSMLILWFSVPNLDVLGYFKNRQAAAAQKEEIRAVSNEVKLAEQKLEDMLKKAKVDVKDEDPAKPDAADAGKPQTPDEMRRAAVKKLTSLTDKLSEMKSGEKAKQMEAMRQMMKQLKQPGPGPLDELTKSMQKGDFAKAQQDLQELAKQMADSKMTEAQREQAQKQMENLAEQLKKLAQGQEEMQRKLEQAGMSKEQAKQATASAEDLKKALDQLKNMSDEEKKELMKQLASKMAACKQCQGMSQSMEKMSKSGKQGMSQQGQEGMEAMGAQLSDAEMMGKDLESLDAAMDEALRQMSSMAGQCKGNCQGDDLRYSDRESPWKAGDSEGKNGGGRGGPGRSGGSAAGSETEAPVAIEKTKANTRQGQGPIIGSRLVQGDQVRGESVAEFQAAVEAANKASTEAIETMQVRRELQDSVKHYFGRLEARVKAQQTAAPKPDGK